MGYLSPQTKLPERDINLGCNEDISKSAWGVMWDVRGREKSKTTQRILAWAMRKIELQEKERGKL